MHYSHSLINLHMTRPKRRVTSSKVPQKVALPVYRFSPSKSPSADEPPPSSGSDSDRDASSPPGSVSQDDDPNESGTDQSHTTSSSGDFPRLAVRPRQRFTAGETAALEQVYQRNKRPSNEIKQRLTRRFNTSVSRIQIWFQNRRAKEKKSDSSSNSQRASAADDKQDKDTDDSEEPSTSSSSSKRHKALAASPPAVAESSTTAAKKRKRQKVPAVSAAIPVTHPYLPSGSYTFAYPGFAAPPMQPMNHQNVSNTPLQPMDHHDVSNPPMPSESFLYQGHPPSHARAGFFIPKYDWHHPHVMHPSFAQAFQGPHPAEKPVRYVDPKKVVKPESPQPALDHMDEQGATSTGRSASKKGKQKQKDADMVGREAEQISEWKANYKTTTAINGKIW